MLKKHHLQWLIVSTALLILSSFMMPQSNEGFVTVRTIEISNGLFDSKICIVYADGTTEEIELEKFRDRSFGPNTAKINEVLNRLRAKGYTLVSASSGNGDGILTNMYVFKK